MLYVDNNLTSLRRKITAKFTLKTQPTIAKNNKACSKPSLVSIEKIPPPIPAKSQKEVNLISKFFKSNKPVNTNIKSYTQASKQNISTSEVIKIKEVFSSIGAKKIDQINNIIKDTPKTKSCIQMTTKELLRKHIIIPMSNDNNSKFMKNFSVHVTNINRALRNAKSEVLADFICSDSLGIIVITNKVSLQLDLQIIEQYIKNLDNIDALQVKVSCFPQSKSYLKIIGIPYFLHGNSQDCLTSSIVEDIIKQNQSFNNITLAFKPRVIKVLPKSNMSIIWIDIWDVQRGSRAKGLINCYFNVGRYIATIREANMNPRVLQCKNCWKWKHSTFSCRIQDFKYVNLTFPILVFFVAIM